MNLTLVPLNLVFSIPEKIKPLSHPVNGKVRYRFRGGEFGYAIVRQPDGNCRWAIIHDEGETWRLDFDVSPPDGVSVIRRENMLLKKEINALRWKIQALENK